MGEDKQDMLGSFAKHGLDQVQLECETILVIVAGADSTATALRTILYYIVSTPLVYDKPVKEIRATKDFSRPVISNSQAQALQYLRAVILEGLRQLQPLFGLGTRNPPKGGMVLGGVFIPEGTEVGIAGHSMLHRKDVFGEDADMFRPERWLQGDDPGRLRAMEKAQELVFGAGRSSCLGKNIAYMELRKVIFEVSHVFSFFWSLLISTASQCVRHCSHRRHAAHDQQI